jgi:Rad3-related DNA helicase
LNSLEEANIIVSSYNQFFDEKNMNFLQNLIKTKEFTVIFDNCENIDNLISEYNSINIDEVIINSASIQALSLKEKILNDHKELLNESYKNDFNKLKNVRSYFYQGLYF